MFKYRSDKKELLDDDNIPEKDLERNLKELHTINRYLGGYAVSFGALKKTLSRRQPAVLVDIGSGGGDWLKMAHAWVLKNGYPLQLKGIDLKPVCVEYSKRNCVGDITFACDDYRLAGKYFPKIDFLHASLFCHHLSEEEIIELVNFAISNKITLLINDLERNPIAYYAIKFLTGLLSSSYLVKNDAPLSVLRGFKRREWESILKRSSATNYSVKNKWAFRHEVIVRP